MQNGALNRTKKPISVRDLDFERRTGRTVRVHSLNNRFPSSRTDFLYYTGSYEGAA